MKDQLIDSIGRIDDDMVERVDTLRHAPKKRSRPVWTRWAAAAACLCLVIVAVTGLVKTGRIPFTGTASKPASGAGGGGSEGITYMSYAGPVFPLTAMAENDALAAVRSIDFDFSPYRTHTESNQDENGAHSYETYASESIITDRYKLSNSGNEAQTVTLLYPFAADLLASQSSLPIITLDGVTIQPALHIGPYCGSFSNASGQDDDNEMWNLAGMNSWEDYRAVVEAGYQSSAFDVFPELSQSVIVYEFKDFYGEKSVDAKAPSLNIEFNIDRERTTVLTFEFNGGSDSDSSGYCARSFFLPQKGSPDYGSSKYLIVLGDDIGDYTVGGFTDLGCETPMENAGAAVTRYESTLGEFLTEAAGQFLKQYSPMIYAETSDTIITGVPEEVFTGLTAELLYSYGIYADRTAERYSEGMLDDIFMDVTVQKRIMYLSFDVTVPANGTVSVSAALTKSASMDFVGKDLRRNGYDMVTRLGSNLIFSEQTASVSNTDAIEIIRDNFGFDLENGITSVTLNPTQEHYWLEVRKTEGP